MASFFEGKIARVAVMNTAFNIGLVPAVYKGQTVVPGNLFYLINWVFENIILLNKAEWVFTLDQE